MTDNQTIEVEHLSKVYGSNVAIEDVHFSVAAGEIIGFLGPNGAGKTTTMRILAGYLPATTGTARVAGYDVHRDAMQVRRNIGYLPETPPLYSEMTVEGFLHFVAKIKGISPGDRHDKVSSAITRCQLADKTKVTIRKLSKGYRQRVGIASAIVHEPPVIILDEPTVGLDPRQIIEVRNLIKSLAGDRTIILSTHILPEVSMTCDRVTIINRGKVVTTDTPTGLREQLESNFGYEVEIEGDNSNILSLLTQISGVTQARWSQNSTLTNRDRRLIEISCNSSSKPGTEIAATIIKQGLHLHEMRRIHPSLEDVFLQLTTEEITTNN